MYWSRIELEPLELDYRSGEEEWCRFSLTLPLVSDGRLAFDQLAAKPEEAVAERFAPDEGCLVGRVVSHDAQCVIAWPEGGWPRQEDVRVFGSRYLRGDVVGLRPGPGPVRLFSITKVEQVTTGVPA